MRIREIESAPGTLAWAMPPGSSRRRASRPSDRRWPGLYCVPALASVHAIVLERGLVERDAKTRPSRDGKVALDRRERAADQVVLVDEGQLVRGHGRVLQGAAEVDGEGRLDAERQAGELVPD